MAGRGGEPASQLDTINEKFAEAREEIECAMEDAETVPWPRPPPVSSGLGKG